MFGSRNSLHRSHAARQCYLLLSAKRFLCVVSVAVTRITPPRSFWQWFLPMVSANGNIYIYVYVCIVICSSSAEFWNDLVCGIDTTFLWAHHWSKGPSLIQKTLRLLLPWGDFIRFVKLFLWILSVLHINALWHLGYSKAFRMPKSLQVKWLTRPIYHQCH